jgi:hypothetical protein
LQDIELAAISQRVREPPTTAQGRLESAPGRVSRVSPVQTAMRNCTRDEGGPFEVGNQVLISSHRKLLLSKAMVVSVAETPGQDSGRQG